MIGSSPISPSLQCTTRIITPSSSKVPLPSPASKGEKSGVCKFSGRQPQPFLGLYSIECKYFGLDFARIYHSISGRRYLRRRSDKILSNKVFSPILHNFYLNWAPAFFAHACERACERRVKSCSRWTTLVPYKEGVMPPPPPLRLRPGTTWSTSKRRTRNEEMGKIINISVRNLFHWTDSLVNQKHRHHQIGSGRGELRTPNRLIAFVTGSHFGR